MAVSVRLCKAGLQLPALECAHQDDTRSAGLHIALQCEILNTHIMMLEAICATSPTTWSSMHHYCGICPSLQLVYLLTHLRCKHTLTLLNCLLALLRELVCELTHSVHSRRCCLLGLLLSTCKCVLEGAISTLPHPGALSECVIDSSLPQSDYTSGCA